MIEARWIDADKFRALYHEFWLKDKLLVMGGRDVMLEVQYSRHRGKKPAGTGATAPSTGNGGAEAETTPMPN
jgi:hypothetical protein